MCDSKGGVRQVNKAELISTVAKNCEGYTKRDVNVILDETLSVIKKAVSNDDKVVLIGFGTFSPAKRKARKVINPQTKEAMKVPAKVVPVFRAGGKFKESVASKGKAKKSKK